MTAQRTLAAAMWTVVSRAATVTMGGEAAFRVLIAMLSDIDLPEFQKSGKLISWPSLRRLKEKTTLSPSTIVGCRTILKRHGLIVCLNPERAGPDVPSVYEIIERPLQKVGQAQSPSLPERVAHAREMRKLHRANGKHKHKQQPQLTVKDWPADQPLPLGLRRASSD